MPGRLPGPVGKRRRSRRIRSRQRLGAPFAITHPIGSPQQLFLSGAVYLALFSLERQITKRAFLRTNAERSQLVSVLPRSARSRSPDSARNAAPSGPMSLLPMQRHGIQVRRTERRETRCLQGHRADEQ